MANRFQMPSTDHQEGGSSHCMSSTDSAYSFIIYHSCSSGTCITEPCIQPHHFQALSRRRIGRSTPSMCSTINSHPPTPPSAVVSCTTIMDSYRLAAYCLQGRIPLFLGAHEDRVRVWQPAGQHVNPAYTVEWHTGPTPSVMVWGAITYDSRTPLIVMRTTLTAQRYVQYILQPHVLPLMAGLPTGIFQQDNARPHTTAVSQACLHNIATLPWSARSLDLSLIEHVWNHLGRQL
ncbi:uncharacterized protein LOC111630777 [Centruroides sculpturatus]|uniref:uncharacterized protein LOC111630777 n=1 Tax=Centruroides sculpturatus TaxID=218467 RepID=UPI000C6E18F2|nr:uncharacterized protein LOC111630777 [Centruroides sculpturatus]